MLETIPFVEQFPYLGLFSLLILGTLGLPFPEDSILLLSGFLTAQNYIKPLQTFGVVYSSLLITDFFLYSVGKKYGRRLVEYKRFQKILKPNTLAKLERQFKRWGGLVVFFGRHVLGLRAQIFLVAGVLKMSRKKFLLADGTSALITIALWGGIGYAGGNLMNPWRKDIKDIGSILMIFLGISVGSVLFLRYLKKRRTSFHLSKGPGLR